MRDVVEVMMRGCGASVDVQITEVAYPLTLQADYMRHSLTTTTYAVDYF